MTRWANPRRWISAVIWAALLVLTIFPDLVPKATRDSLSAPAPVWLVLLIGLVVWHQPQSVVAALLDRKRRSPKQKGAYDN